jgi:hypothetical protein
MTTFALSADHISFSITALFTSFQILQQSIHQFETNFMELRSSNNSGAKYITFCLLREAHSNNMLSFPSLVTLISAPQVPEKVAKSLDSAVFVMVPPTVLIAYHP